MADSVEVGTQVIVRKKIRSGNLVRIGSVLKVDGDKALVQFPLDHSQSVLPVASLEKTSERFGGYARVSANSIHRSIFKRKGLA